MSELSNEDLLAQLGVEVKKEKKSKLTAVEQRTIAGFDDIQRFVDEHGKEPSYGDDKEIFERLYATRLEQIRSSKESVDLLKDYDRNNLLSGESAESNVPDQFTNDEELLSALGVSAPKDDLTQLKHVKSYAEKKAAQEIASRTPCADFDEYKGIFDTVQFELKEGIRTAELLTKQPSIEVNDLFILQGQKVLVAEAESEFVNENGFKDKRLRVIYDNGTESNLLMRSLQKALKQDETGRRIMDRSIGPLFDELPNSDDASSGIIYVLRSNSPLEAISNNRNVIHKIGVTGGKVERRIANSKEDPTFLMSDVEIVASYELFNINRIKLERLLHKFFEHCRLEIEVLDRFGKPVAPKEWFLVPLFIIDEVVERIKNGTIEDYVYDKDKVALVEL